MVYSGGQQPVFREKGKGKREKVRKSALRTFLFLEKDNGDTYHPLISNRYPAAGDNGDRHYSRREKVKGKRENVRKSAKRTFLFRKGQWEPVSPANQ